MGREQTGRPQGPWEGPYRSEARAKSVQSLKSRRPKVDAGPTTAMQRLAARLAVADQIEVRPSGEYASASLGRGSDVS